MSTLLDVARAAPRRMPPSARTLFALAALAQTAACGGDPSVAGGGRGWWSGIASSGTARVEQDDPSITYSGHWYPNSFYRHSGGTAALAQGATARATFAFNGTAARWIGYRDRWSGIASVYVDGWYVGKVDTYASPSQSQVVLFETDGLPPGDHTLTVEPLQMQNATSGGAWIWIDGFEYEWGGSDAAAEPVIMARLEQDNPAVSYTGDGWHDNTLIFHSGGTARLAMNATAQATLTFVGTGVRWIGYTDPWTGYGRVYLDGELVSTMNGYTPHSHAQVPLFSVKDLVPGTHTLTIAAMHGRSEISRGRWVWVDAFDVVP
jgi:hypothetical protein